MRRILSILLATILYRQAGSPVTAQDDHFSDVETGSWYSSAAAWASANGIISGYSDGRFGPNDTVTREQIATILWRAAGTPAAGQGVAFADEGSISPFATQAVDWARGNGIINGKEGNRFDPKGNATRAEVAAILHRYLGSDSSTGVPLPEDGAPQVYMTTDISAEGLMTVYRALGVSPDGNHVAVKLSTGEPGSNYLKPALIQDLVREVNGTIVECNTAYGGSRANTAMHYQVAEDHGYTAIADVDIMDEDGSIALPLSGGTNLSENYVGTHFSDYDYFVVISHFKGHSMAGFGGAIKNSSIGIASAQGKSWIHSDATDGQTFADQGSIASYASPAVAWARAQGIVSGKSGNRFDPNGMATRAETAVMLQRYGTLGIPTAPPSDEPNLTPPSSLRIQVQAGTHTIQFELNDSPAAKSLYDQLPLTIAVQDYSDNEKIFYPPQKLDTTDAIGAEGPAGTLAYFAPWGDVVMYYSSCGPYGGLYELGHAVSGGEQIENLSGTLQITQILD